MTFFNKEKYYSDFIGNINSQEKKQVKFFFDFLQRKLEATELEEEYFALISGDDLLESLEAYIIVSKITAKGTASAYLGSLKKLYENLLSNYGVENTEIYVNKNFVPYVTEKAKKQFAVLNDSIDKETASDEEYEIFLSNIEAEESKYSYDKAVNGLNKYIFIDDRNELSDGPDEFRLIRAVCASRMVAEFGIKNNEINKLKIDDLDLEKGVIKRGQYQLRLTENFRNSLIKYLSIRDYLLSILNKNQNLLFVTRDGDKIPSAQLSNKLFGSIVSNSNEKRSKSSEYFARKSLTRMINQGFNYAMINEITGYKMNTYKQLCAAINNDKEYIKNKLIDFTTSDKDYKVETINKNNMKSSRKKGYLTCENCGKNVKAIAENLVLVKLENDENLYVWCKECGEHYEKNRKHI